MGIPPWIVHSSALGSNMKMFAVLALAAVAFAEPEPQVVYSGVPVSTVYNNPLTYSSPLLRSFTPYTTYNRLYRTPVVHSIGKRDADADPATVYTTGVPVSTYGAVHHVAGVNNVVAPIAAVSPVSTYSAVSPVSTYSAVRPVSTYSAVSPVSTISAVNHAAIHSIGKRDADADPATVYTSGVPVSTYGAVHHVAGVNNVVASVSPVSTYTAVNPVSTYTAVRPVASHVVPATYAASHVVPATYAAGHVVKGAYAPHSVAATPFGYTHSSNVGVCTNNMGVQVPC